MGKKDKGAKQKGPLKKIITFLMITHPIEALIAARKAKKLGLNHRRWFLATLLFGVFASSRMKAPAAVEVEVVEAPKGKKAKKAAKKEPEKKEKAKKSKKTDGAKIIIEVVEDTGTEAGGKAGKGRKNKKPK